MPIIYAASFWPYGAKFYILQENEAVGRKTLAVMILAVKLFYFNCSPGSLLLGRLTIDAFAGKLTSRPTLGEFSDHLAMSATSYVLAN